MTGPFEEQVDDNLQEMGGADFHLDHKAFRASPASYAKNKVSVQPKDGKSGQKGVAARLAGALKMKWSNRGGSYITSVSKAKKLAALIDAGWDASSFSGEFTHPEDAEYRAALRKGNFEYATQIATRVVAAAKKMGIKPGQIKFD